MIRTRAMRAFTSGALIFCLLLSSCAHMQSARSVVALPNGYYIDRDRNSELRIVTRSGRKIIGPISGYAVYSDIVTGLVGPEVERSGAYPNESPLPESDQPNYFVLDTRTGQIEKGLTAEAWKARLAELKVASNPRLRVPLLPS
ncbi:MAG TPA: hypothetical protein VIL32_00425 [Steroidobacteraceae bacterium]